MHVLTLRPAGLRKGTPPSYVSVWVNLLTSLPALKEAEGAPLAVYGATLTAAFSISLIQTFLQATQTFKPPASNISPPPPQGAGQGGPGHALLMLKECTEIICNALYV